MAGTNYSAAFSFVTPNITSNIRPRKLLLLAYTTTTPSKHVKYTRRRNSLRPKILKIPPQPHSPPTHRPSLPQKPPENPVILVIPPETLNEELPVAAEDNKVEEEELRSSETTGISNGSVGEISGRYFLKFGVYLCGAFVLQTVYAVWVLANQKDRDLDSSYSEKNRVSLSRDDKALSFDSVSESSNLGSFDEVQVGEKIEEIRAMAKQARKVERNEKNGQKKDSRTRKIGFGRRGRSWRRRRVMQTGRKVSNPTVRRKGKEGRSKLSESLELLLLVDLHHLSDLKQEDRCNQKFLVFIYLCSSIKQQLTAVVWLT